MKTKLLILLICLLGLTGAHAQDVPMIAKPPVLTTEQKQAFQIVVLRIQLAQAQMQQAQTEAAALLQSFAVPGWTLDPNTLAYTPIAKAEPSVKSNVPEPPKTYGGQ